LKITIEPENEEEKKQIGKKLVYDGVKEHLVLGVQLKDFLPVNFYSWTGSHSYLIGQTYYMLKKLEADEHGRKDESK
jgi:hypothetical protein